MTTAGHRGSCIYMYTYTYIIYISIYMGDIAKELGWGWRGFELWHIKGESYDQLGSMCVH